MCRSILKALVQLQADLSDEAGRGPHADTPAVPGVRRAADPRAPVPPLLPRQVPEALPQRVPAEGGARLGILHKLGTHSVGPVMDTLEVTISCT